MSRVSTYLNFMGQTEEAFGLYQQVFGSAPARLTRFSDMGGAPGAPTLSEEEQSKILHAELDIVNGHVLMATDMLESMGHQVRIGNNTTISLEFDSKEEADRIYQGLALGGSEGTGMADMPWGAYWGCTLDPYGIRWMVQYTAA